MKFVRRLAVSAAIVVGAALAQGATASAESIVPFQINPAPYGNPNGSFDAPAGTCVAVTGGQPGAVTITGGKEGRWGCFVAADVRWVNLSTGASGAARMSDGLFGFPPEAILQTGPGQVAVVIIGGGINTAGLATFSVS
nr:hypothetical protein [Rhodococcus sp. (in: high G+C Gram-positive bacteria)]